MHWGISLMNALGRALDMRYCISGFDMDGLLITPTHTSCMRSTLITELNLTSFLLGVVLAWGKQLRGYRHPLDHRSSIMSLYIRIEIAQLEFMYTQIGRALWLPT